MKLAHAIVTAEGATPDTWVVILHGILGSGANWRTFAKRLVAARPSWGAVLVDLRLHGESQGAAPPHTLEAAAGDVLELAGTLPGRGMRAVLGHSFGGKVALEVSRLLAGELDQVVVVDSTPSARPGARGSEGTQHIVDLLRELPSSFDDRAAFTAWAEARGVNRPTAMWLAMNVRPLQDDGPKTRYGFRLDIAGIRAMLDDYFVRDLWGAIEEPGGPVQFHFVVGGKSTVLDAQDLERLRRCARVTLDVLPQAGHWVHVDAPDELERLVLARAFPLPVG